MAISYKTQEASVSQGVETRAAQRPGWLDETLYPFQSRFVNIAGNRIHYIDEGEGPVILFLHSNAVWSFVYRNIVRGLRDEFRCIALDYPGFGLSTAASDQEHTLLGYTAIVEEFVQALGLADMTLFAHDAGGPIGLGVVSKRPEWFRALALTSTFGFPLKGYLEPQVILKVIGSRFPGHFLVDYLNIIVRSISSQGMKRRNLTKAERAAYDGPFAKRSSRRPMNTLFASISRNYDYLAQMEQKLMALDDMPVLLLPGEKSGEIKLGYVSRFQNIFPHNHTVVLKGAGHFGAEDAPDEIVMAVRTWWNETIAS